MKGPTRTIALAVAAVLLSAPSLLGVRQQQARAGDAFAEPERLLTSLYAAVTFKAGSLPDWTYVRSMFIDEAVVLLRTTRTDTTVFSVDGFVADFERFIAEARVADQGFVERIHAMRSWVFRDMAHALVLYSACIPGRERPPQLGIDSFLLQRRDGRWWITALTNDIVDEAHPVPRELWEPGQDRPPTAPTDCEIREVTEPEPSTL
ncbi:MAG TPA: hypothetical protein VLA20_10270 [Vicinamibacterales bacterium]|nr:hypothetical protein [Vicinamibacterales bacterium]